MKQRLRVLIVEDSEDDELLLLEELRRSGFDIVHVRVQTAEAMRAALTDQAWDVVVSDYAMPAFSGMAALSVLKETGIDVPLIIASGTIGEETAVEALKAGASDFVSKDRLARLIPAIKRELREAGGRRERREIERVLSETKEWMHFAMQAASVGLWQTEFASGRTIWSDVQEQLHGLSVGGFGGTVEAFVDRIDPEDRQRAVDSISQGLRDRTDSRLEYRTTWPDGSVHWIVRMGRTFYSQGGDPIRAAGVCLDITTEKTLKEQFHQAQKMEAVGRLAGGIAHDFNNLLTVIIGYSDLLLDRVADQADVAPDIGEIKKAGERASRLTNQLLAFSRKQPMAPRILNLNEVVSDIEKMLSRVIGDDITLEIAAAPSLGSAKVDPGHVEQLLLNLVVNARDAMPRGGTVKIATANRSLDADFVRRHVGAVPGSYVSLTVTDSGCGMKPEVLARVFEPFFTTKPIGKGTGLGLSTVYGIVKQNGGYITVDSALGTGTTFTIYLPHVDGPAEALSSGPSPARALTGKETVLLVEDEAGVRELVRKTLERYGYHVLPAQDADDATVIEGRYSGHIHLLLTDIVMPGLTGPDLAQRLVRRRPSMAVLYMSGFVHRVAVDLGSISTKTSFLQKPFTPVGLATKVRECLDRHAGSLRQESMPR
jgi:signal transduction histidine kinase